MVGGSIQPHEFKRSLPSKTRDVPRARCARSLRSGLPAVANEMATDPRQTSDKLMIYEVRDYCTALLNLDGELISQNVGGAFGRWIETARFTPDRDADFREALRRAAQVITKEASLEL